MATAQAVETSSQFLMYENTFRKKVSEGLTRVTGVYFPFPTPKGGLERDATVGPSYRMTAHRCNLLRKFGYTIVRENALRRKDNKLRMDKEHVRWWFESSMQLTFHAHWGRDDDGISVYLDTDPNAGGGNHLDSQNLALILHDHGFDLHPYARYLVVHDGVARYSWHELGMEPNTSLHDCFTKFVERYEMRYLIHRLARDYDHSPLRPSPYEWHLGRRGTWEPSETIAYVPVECRKELHQRWHDQLEELAKRLTAKA